jgi:hypothetical protein
MSSDGFCPKDQTYIEWCQDSAFPLAKRRSSTPKMKTLAFIWTGIALVALLALHLASQNFRNGVSDETDAAERDSK